MNFKTTITLLLLSFFSLRALAQQGKIQGRITGPDKAPLSAITIRLEPGNSAVQTDDQGGFRFHNIAPGSYVLVASGVAHQAKSSQVQVTADKTVFLELELDIARAMLREVSITGSRAPSASRTLTRMNIPMRDLPQNIQSVSRSVLDDQQLFQLDEVFRNVAGITSTDYYGGFSSRGYTSSASGITTNGIKGSPYPEGQIALLGNIESVEVIHGPSAILFGPGGMGGNINLVTKQPKKFTALNASVTGGSFSLFRAQADVTGSLTKKKDLYFLAGAALQNGGSFLRDFDRRNLQVFGSLKWEITPRTSWQMNANYINDDVSNNYQPRIPIYNTLNPDSLFIVPYDFNFGTDSRYKGNNVQVQSILEHHFSESWKLGFLAAFNRSDADRRQYTASGYVRPSDQTVSRSYSWQKIHSPQTTINLYGVGKAKTWIFQHHFSFGGDAVLSVNDYPDGILQYEASRINVFHPSYEQKYDSTGMTLYTNSKFEKFTYNTLGAYVMDQIELLPRLKALAGLRYNNYFRRLYAERQDGSVLYDERPSRTENFSPRVGLVYQPVKTISIYADYNEGFSPHYSNYPDRGGPFDPETSKQYELGVKGEFLNGALLPFITVYESTKRNVLQSAPRDGFPYWQEAIGAVRSRGVEMGFSGTILPNLYMILNYNYNKTKITEAKKPEDIGQLFANNPQNSANGWLRYSLTNGALKGLFIGSGFQYVDSRYFGNKKKEAVVAEIPEYWLFDALAGYRYRAFTIQLNASNVFDKRYAASGSYAAYTPGTPRNLQATLRYQLR